MKKIVSLVMAVLLGLLLVGCGNSGGKPADNKPAAPSTRQDSAEADPAPAGADVPQEPGKPAAPADLTAPESYAAYVEAKSELVTLIIDALGSDPDLAMESMSLLGVVMVDMMILPAASLGLGQEAAAAGLAMIGATDVQYTESGNRYTITYTGSEGEKYEFQATYDAAADAMVCEVVTLGDGGGIYYEYRKTPFGYVGQVYSFEGDTITELFQITVHENGGVIGFSDSNKKPAALTGGEAKDFPEACPQWYAMDGTAFTGVTGAGEELSFEYTP